MAGDNEERESSLSEQGQLHVGSDEARLKTVTDSLEADYDRKQPKVISAEKAEANAAYIEKYGAGKAWVEMDRSIPIGRGEGFRNTTDWRDHRDQRLFRLDQGMSDQDEARSPTMESTEALYRSTEYLQHAIDQTQQLDPDLAYELQLADRFLIMYPELAVTTRNGFGFAGITEQLAAELTGNSVPEFAAQAATSFVAQSDIGDQFYTEFGNQLDPGTKDLLTVSLAGLSEKEQKHMWGLAAAYLDARPLSTLEDQIQFANWAANEASSIYEIENDQSLWGKIGRVGAHVFTNPADWVQDEVIGSLWTAASDGADAWYRKELQLEETMAISMGHDVGTTGWSTFTGLAGAGIDIFIDPLNIALGGLAGLKAVKTAAILDDAVRGGSRFRNVARQFVPVGSRSASRAIGLPTGVRGRSSRILWTAFAKTQDGMMTTARNNGVFDTIARGTSYSVLIEKIPELKNVDPGLVQMMLRRTDATEVEALYDAALRGSLLDPASMAHIEIMAAEIDAQADIKKLLTDLTPLADDGTMAGYTAGDIAAANGGGVYHNLPVNLEAPQSAIKIEATGGERAIKKLSDMNGGDIQDVVDITGDPAVLARIEEYRNGTKNIASAIGDEVDAEIMRIANDRRGTSILKSDPGAWKSVKSAYQRAVDSGMELTEEAFDLGGGVMGTARHGQSDELGRVTGVFDETGKLVGSRVDELAAVQHEAQGKGVYGRILELQRDKLGLTADIYAAETGPRTVDAARVGARVFDRPAITGELGSAADPLAEGVVSFISKADTKVANISPGSASFDNAVAWIRKNTKYADNGINKDGTINKAALQAYMRAHDIDVATINGTAVFTDLDGLRDAGKITQFAGGAAGDSGLADASNKLQVAAYERRMVTPKADTVSKWVISDMPTKVRTPAADFRFWNRQFGVFAGKKYSEANFLVRKARGLVASVFLDDAPARIATGWGNRQEGVSDLRRLLTQMNVDPDLVRRSLDEYLDDPSQAKVLEILTRAGDDMGDPELSLGLMKFNQKQTSQYEYAVINNSDQLTQGRRIDGGEALQPLLPSQTRQFVQLPDQKAFTAHIRRAKRAQNRTFKSRNRGWGRTKANRQKIIDNFGNQFSEGSEQAARWAGMTLDEQFAVAYATVRPRGSELGDGLGYAAKFGQTFGEGYGRLRNAFSVAMLAWRPIGWMGNEVLDNAWRAAMADGLSFFTKPFQSVTAIHDSRNIARSIEQRALYQEATAGVRAILRAADDPAVMLDRVAAVVPDIRKYVDVAEDSKKQADAIRKFLNTELITNTDAIKVMDAPLAQALRRQRKGYQAAQKYDLPTTTVKGELFDPNWDEVGLTGMEQNFTAEVSAATGRHEWIQGVRRSPEELEDYTSAVGNVWARDLRDPLVRMYLQQVAELGAGGEDAGRAARAFVNSNSWHTMEEPVRNMARFDGIDVDAMDDLALAQWYIKNKISPYVDDIFGDALTAENVPLMLHGSFIGEVNGAQYIVDIDDPRTVTEFIQAANGTDYVLPKSVVGVVNPRSVFGYGKETDGWKTPLKSYNQWALEKFGHDIPAAVQRRPAYITSFKRFKNNYMQLGMTEEGADFAANQKALEHIQKTFFFVEAQTPFLKKMNEIFPFFAAQYEIVKAWTWNIPAAQGGFGIGHARMLRTFDHVFTSMRENGLLQPRYNREGGVEGWDLQFASDPHTDNLAGQMVSRAGHLALMSPAIVVEQLAEIFTQADLDLTTDEINFKFNHPFGFFGKGGGVLPTARMQFGLNPAMGLPASMVIEQLPFTSTSNAAIMNEEENLDLWLAEENVTDKTQFLTANRHALLESGAVTREEFDRLMSGTLGFATITVPEGTELMLPGTTLAGDFIQNVLQPYGATDSLQEVVADFTPRVVSNMARTMGLWLNDGEDGATSWLPNLLMGPTGRMGMGTARADAIIMLEMQTGVITRQGEVAEELAAAEAGSAEAHALEDELRALDEFTTKEVKEVAASRAFMQTVYGVIMPFNPKMPTESQTLREYFHQGRMVSDQWAEGKPMPMPFDDRNATEAWQMVAAWAADETGSQAKQEFLTQHGGRSSILAAIAPRTYWGGVGLPVWASDMTEYFAQVEEGAIQPLPVDVLRYKIRSMQLQVEREMIYVEEYGNDPKAQALKMAQDGAYLTEISELYDEKWRALEIEDELVNDGAWAEYSRDNASTYVDYAHNEQIEKLDAIKIAEEEMDLELFPEDPQEAKQILGRITGIKQSYYDAVEVYTDGRYADWDVSPRQQYLNEYYTKMGDYYGELEKQYAKTEQADTQEELSAAYDEVARWRREHSDRPLIVDGSAFPSPAEYSWNNMDREHQTAQVDAKLADKLEWLSWADVDHIIDIYPKAEAFMPTSEEAKDIFLWKGLQDGMLARKYRIGGEFIDLNDGSSKPRQDHQKMINEEFERRLRAAGEFGVLENMNNYPIENFSKFDALPKGMEWLVPVGVAVHRELAGKDKSPMTNAAKIQQRWVWRLVIEEFQTKPHMRDEFLLWGMRVFQESTVEGIVAQLLGNYKGELD